MCIRDRPTTYLQHCRYRGLDGVVIACVDFNHPQVQELVDSGLPLVTIDPVSYTHLPGYLADFIVLSQDIFSVPENEIVTTKVEQTYLGGQLVYSR